jgi:hypothetical protein
LWCRRLTRAKDVAVVEAAVAPACLAEAAEAAVSPEAAVSLEAALAVSRVAAPA